MSPDTPQQHGLLDLDHLAQLVGQGRIDTVVAGFTDLYGRFLGKRFEARFFLEQVAERGTHACDYLLTVDMEMEPVPGYQFANWQRGYGDVHLVPDLATLREARWLDRSALVICDVAHEQDHRPVRQAPRTLLRTQRDRAAERGWTAMAASELEYYIFRESYREAAERDHRDTRSAGWYIEDYHLAQGARVEDYNQAARLHLAGSGVAVESSKGEWGVGQHELNLQYTEILEMADRHAIQKQCMRELADRMGISVTFMAKYAEQRAGSSCHVHVSLWHEGKNAFDGDELLGPLRCSTTFRHFLGGWMQHLPEVMVLAAPTINSYKRFQSGSWAPTRIAWSRDNRTAGFRIVGSGSSLRIECRVPGADCNPYLVYASLLAAGLDGIEKRTEPPPYFQGDVYAADDVPHVPKSLRDAVDLFEHSRFARSTFGDDIVDHYVHFFRTEQAAYDRAVTDWERRRYFERI